MLKNRDIYFIYSKTKFYNLESVQRINAKIFMPCYHIYVKDKNFAGVYTLFYN